MFLSHIDVCLSVSLSCLKSISISLGESKKINKSQKTGKFLLILQGMFQM